MGKAPDEVKRLVSRLRPLGKASVRGRLYDLGEYPGAILDDKADSVIFGEVFELPDAPSLFKQLDSYEGFEPHYPQSSLFLRERCTASLDGGREVECWIYTYNGDVNSAPLIPSGSYIPSELKY